MYMDIATVLGGVFGGGMAGAGVTRHRIRRSQPQGVISPMDIDVRDGWIDGASAQWAEDHGRPEIKSLIAKKLRLAQALQQQRMAGRWSR
jgi:hypothetical protein